MSRTLFYFVLNTELNETTPQRKNFTARIQPERCIKINPITSNVVLGMCATVINKAKLIINPSKGISNGTLIIFPIYFDLKNKDKYYFLSAPLFNKFLAIIYCIYRFKRMV